MRSDCNPPSDSSKPRILGLVMAAGFSRRFGGDDKRSASLAGGGNLLRRTLTQVRPAFTSASGDCLLAAVVRPEDCPSSLGIPEECIIVRAPNAARGLGASIADAMHAVGEMRLSLSINSVSILLGDMPAIRPETLSTLMTFSCADNIVRPRHHNRPGHPVIFGRKFWPALRALGGEDGAREVIAANTSALEMIEVKDPGVLQDIDTREALDLFPATQD